MFNSKVEDFIDKILNAKGEFSENDVNAVWRMTDVMNYSKAQVQSYMEVRLAEIQKEKEELKVSENAFSTPASGKHGVVKTCPNCGATVESGSAKCNECGYIFSGVGANSSAAELDRRLRSINGTGSDSEKKRANIISSFPIPNTREDLFEFMAATAPKAFNRHKNGEEQVIGKAYYEKFVEALNKARISFPDDPNTKRFEKELAKNKKKIHISGEALGIIVIMIGIVVYLICNWYYEDIYVPRNKEKLSIEYLEWKNPIVSEIEEYSTSLSKKIEELPTPTTSNYKTCITKLSSISWDKSWQVPEKYRDVATTDERIDGIESSYKEAFEKNIKTYKKAIGSAWRQDCRRRGLDEDQIHDEIPYEYR